MTTLVILYEETQEAISKGAVRLCEAQCYLRSLLSKNSTSKEGFHHMEPINLDPSELGAEYSFTPVKLSSLQCNYNNRK